MALGIDVYRYQTVADWVAVRNHGVKFVYVKGSDGGGPAVVRADGQVKGAKFVDLPVGLYHYAQMTPSPETQANVLTGEVHRLDADGLPPALDLESPFVPNELAKVFALRFLLQLKANGFDRVAIYGNTSMFAGIRPDQWSIPGLVIWAARYGQNTGERHPDLRPYTGRADIHQYTSVGAVPGITGNVDLNESLTNFWEGEDMSWTDQLTFSGPDGKTHTYAAEAWLMWTNYYANMIPVVAQEVAGLRKAIEVLAQAVAGGDDVDAAELKAAVQEAIAESIVRVQVITQPEQATNVD